MIPTARAECTAKDNTENGLWNPESPPQALECTNYLQGSLGFFQLHFVLISLLDALGSHPLCLQLFISQVKVKEQLWDSLWSAPMSQWPAARCLCVRVFEKGLNFFLEKMRSGYHICVFFFFFFFFPCSGFYTFIFSPFSISWNMIHS